MARFRSSDTRQTSSYVFMYAGTAYPGSGPMYGRRRDMTDIVIPNYRKEVAKGKVFMNYMESRSQDVALGVKTHIAGSVNGQDFFDSEGSNLQHISCHWPGHSDWNITRWDVVPASSVLALADEVCTRTLSQIGRSDAANWENIAEVGKTVAMLRAPVQSFLKFLNSDGAVRRYRRSISGVGSLSKDLGLTATNAWLAFRYGVMPVVRSVDDTLKQLRKNLKYGSEVVRMTTRSSHAISGAANSLLQQSDGTYISDVAIRKSASHQVRAMSLDEVVWDVPTLLGLGSKDLLTLPWELIRLSFVADWFANVGDYIGAMSQAMYPKSLGQCYTLQSTRTEYRETITHTVPANYIINSFRRGWVREDTVWKTRYPGLRAPKIGIRADFRFDDLTRVADAFALTAAQLRNAPFSKLDDIVAAFRNRKIHTQ